VPSLSPFALNPYSVTNVPRLDYTNALAPTTKVYHGASIVVNNNIVGRVQSWQPTQYQREGVLKYELSHNTWGRPVDYVPGKVGGRTVAMTRTEVWYQELEIALGWPAVFEDLMDQTYPWVTDEYLYRGGPANLYRLWRVIACWFSTKDSSSWESEGDGVETVQAQINYVNRIRIV